MHPFLCLYRHTYMEQTEDLNVANKARGEYFYDVVGWNVGVMEGAS